MRTLAFILSCACCSSFAQAPAGSPVELSQTTYAEYSSNFSDVNSVSVTYNITIFVIGKCDYKCASQLKKHSSAQVMDVLRNIQGSASEPPFNLVSRLITASPDNAPQSFGPTVTTLPCPLVSRLSGL